ncbi:hypothetical protein B0T18DRAFT_410342 [Schizothecium vesticola]|uniref:Uncharacterized protein n=1 Tax=Schizothecium vesticola TaxID=314040 RepID=A0AA40EUQ7_9PEZI|nr:hypothetical protein B0T18DRAFT_410342 [Schizothecium vesticola]
MTHPTKSDILWNDRQTNTHLTQIPLRIDSTLQHTWTRDLDPTVPRAQRDQGPPPIPEVPTNSLQLRPLATPHLLLPSTVVTPFPLAITISIPSISALPRGTRLCQYTPALVWLLARDMRDISQSHLTVDGSPEIGTGG